MSNKYRTATQTRRGARSGFPEHDDFEGLPVRQWRQEWVSVASAPPTESNQQNDIWDRELFYGMPKDAPLLPPHSQELLRLARSGRLYKRPAPADEDDMDTDGLDTKGDKKDGESGVEGFMVKTWKQMPGNSDGPNVSHLAKRHKNTVTLPPKAMLAQITGPTATRHKVRRIDAAGNPYEQTVTVADGQKVDGEIISTTIVPLHTANPDGLAAQPQATPARRRPPPPKRKAKGPGRGRKKGRLPLAAGAGAGGVAAPAQQPLPDGTIPPAVKTETSGSDLVKIEENEDSANQDSEMADGSAMPSEDEDGDDGDEGDEDGGPDDGDDQTPEIENVGDQDHEMEDVTEVIRPSSIEEPIEGAERRRSTSEEEITVPKPPRFQPPLGLGALGSHFSSPRHEGSPLKNVIIQSPVDQSPLVSPQASFGGAASSYMGVHTAISSVVGGLGADGASDAPNQQPPVATAAATEGDTVKETATPGDGTSSSEPPKPAAGAAVETIAPTIESPRVKEPESVSAAEAVSATPLIKEEKEISTTPVVSVEITQPSSEAAAEATEPEKANSEPRPEPPDSPTLHPTATGADEDEGLNLLGSLERELDRQEDSLSRSGSAVGDNDKGAAAGTTTEAAPAPDATVSDSVAPAPAPAAGADAGDAKKTPSPLTAAEGGVEAPPASAPVDPPETKQE